MTMLSGIIGYHTFNIKSTNKRPITSKSLEKVAMDVIQLNKTCAIPQLCITPSKICYEVQKQGKYHFILLEKATKLPQGRLTLAKRFNTSLYEITLVNCNQPIYLKLSHYWSKLTKAHLFYKGNWLEWSYKDGTWYLRCKELDQVLVMIDNSLTPLIPLERNLFMTILLCAEFLKAR